MSNGIKAIDQPSVHRITSGQVVIDLTTAVKELLENSLDAGATNIEIKFREYGLALLEVIDNGAGVSPDDFASLDDEALKHHTSKLSSFSDLTTLRSFGFRGEALSALCALCNCVTVTSATRDNAPGGFKVQYGRTGEIKSKTKVARARGTTVSLTSLFTPLPVRRAEFTRHAKREFGKAVALLTAYALVPCTQVNGGVRLTVVSIAADGKKATQLRTDGSKTVKSSVSSLWGARSLNPIVDLDLTVAFVARKGDDAIDVRVRGLISKFALSCGRSGPDRQYFYVNGRPCNLPKIQKAVNELYRTFNATQSPLIIADLQLPTDACDINVSPDKRTIFVHGETALIEAIKNALEEKFAPTRSTLTVQTQLRTQISSPSKGPRKQNSDSSQNVILSGYDDADYLFPEDGEGGANSRPEAADALSLSGVPEEPLVSVASKSGDEGTGVQPVIPNASGAVPSVSLTSQHPKILEESHNALSTPPRIAGSSRHVDVGNPSRNPLSEAHEREVVNSHVPQETAGPVSPARTVSSRVSPHLFSFPSRSNSTSSKAEIPVQRVLSTAGASWSLGPRDKPPRKKPRINAIPLSSQQSLRDSLRSFARESSTTKDAPHVNELREDIVEDIDVQGVNSENEDLDIESPANYRWSLGQSDGSMQMEVDPSGAHSRRTRLTKVEHISIDLTQAESPRYDPSELSVSTGTTDVELTQEDESDDLSIISADNSRVGSVVAPGESTSRDPRESEICRTGDTVEVPHSIDLTVLRTRWESARSYAPAHMAANTDSSLDRVPKAAGFGSREDAQATAEALSRVIDKSDFATMEVLGQFNLGFILVRRRLANPNPSASCMDDLFIIDQHAADEKFNFERLQRDTVIESQQLLQPRPLELAATDELVASENIAVLQNNGFDVAIDENAPSGCGQKLLLISQPVSKSTTFDTKDLEELIHLLHDATSGAAVRCSKARAMFAMRACRSSVMVGMPLPRARMESIVQHMGTMDQPWNCPHGRPTMRHLLDLKDDLLREKHRQVVDWAALAV